MGLAELTGARAHEVAAWVNDDEAALPASAVAALTGGDAVTVLDGDALVAVLVVGPLAHPVGADPDPHGATDVWLTVDPSRRAEGIATRAAELAVEALRIGGHGRLRACVPVENLAGRTLALRLGFTVVERVEGIDGAYDVLEREVLA